MKMRITSFAILALVSLLLTTHVQSQATNPPYLREMPTVDRVTREIQGKDAADTAERQVGAFMQLIKIIDAMQGTRGGASTPDENRIRGDYRSAYDRIWQSRPELKAVMRDGSTPTDLGMAYLNYDGNPGFRSELLNRFFSADFRAQYFKANADAEARYQQYVKANTKVYGGAPPAQQETDDPGTLAARRCVAAGRDPMQCAAETMKKEFNVLMGGIAPSAKKTEPPSGLRMNGTYPGPGRFGLTFGPAAVAVTCGALKPEGHAYTVATNGDQILVTIQNEPKPILVALRSDGKLAGPGPTDIKGQVVVGQKTTQTTEQKRINQNEARQYNPLDVRRDMSGGLYVDAPATTTIPVHETRTERCNIGVLATTGATPALELDTVLGTKGFDASARKMASSQEIKATPGLRMIGEYAGQGGFGIEFHNESAVLECREAVVARAYTVNNTGSQVTIQHSPNPLVLALGPDGKLTGSGSIQVAGRVVVGMSPDNQVIYAPKTGNCTVGTLAPKNP